MVIFGTLLLTIATVYPVKNTLNVTGKDINFGYLPGKRKCNLVHVQLAMFVCCVVLDGMLTVT